MRGSKVLVSPLAGWPQVFLGLGVFWWFVFFFSCYCFSHMVTKTSLSQDFLLSVFLLSSFMSTVRPFKNAAW